MAKKTVHIGLDQSTVPARVDLTLAELQDDGFLNVLELSANDVLEIFLDEAEASEVTGLPYFEFFPKKLPGLQWQVDFAARPTNPDTSIASPFDEQTYLSDESESLSEGINPDEPPDPDEEAPISAELNNVWAAQVPANVDWEFDFTVSFVGHSAQPATRRLRARRR
jgi:hypothetical protein